MENTSQMKETSQLPDSDVVTLEQIFAVPEAKINKNTLEWAFDQGRRTREVVVKRIGNDLYANSACLTLLKPYEPEPVPCFDAFSLDGLCDWLNADVDGNIELYKRLFIHVCDERTVTVETRRAGLEGNSRFTLARCAFPLHAFPWGRYIDQESFVVMLLSRFAADKEGSRDAVGAFVGKIKQEQSSKTMDDGVTQKISVKQGVSLSTDVAVKNPVYLAPQRTFTEIEQPISPFVLRVQEGPEIALFEADDGAWKNEAVSRIAAYIRSRLEYTVSDKVTIIA